jgi:hypothetical protein
MKLRNMIVAAVLPFSVMVACGGTASDSGDGDGDGDGDGSASVTGSSSDDKDDVCEEFCEEISECDGVSVTECTDSCTGNTSTSRAGQAVINECFDSNLCDAEISDSDGAGALLCLIVGASDIDLSSAAETYCEDTVDTINDCLESEPDPEASFGSCEGTIGLASDEVLEGLNACAEKPCDEVEACVELEALKAIPLETLLTIGEGEPSPQVLADLFAIGVVFGQLGLDDEGGGLFGDEPDTSEPTDPPPAMGGAAGR